MWPNRPHAAADARPGLGQGAASLGLKLVYRYPEPQLMSKTTNKSGCFIIISLNSRPMRHGFATLGDLMGHRVRAFDDPLMTLLSKVSLQTHQKHSIWLVYIGVACLPSTYFVKVNSHFSWLQISIFPSYCIHKMVAMFQRYWSTYGQEVLFSLCFKRHVGYNHQNIPNTSQCISFFFFFFLNIF